MFIYFGPCNHKSRLQNFSISVKAVDDSYYCVLRSFWKALHCLAWSKQCFRNYERSPIEKFIIDSVPPSRKRDEVFFPFLTTRSQYYETRMSQSLMAKGVRELCLWDVVKYGCFLGCRPFWWWGQKGPLKRRQTLATFMHTVRSYEVKDWREPELRFPINWVEDVTVESEIVLQGPKFHLWFTGFPPSQAICWAFLTLLTCLCIRRSDQNCRHAKWGTRNLTPTETDVIDSWTASRNTVPTGIRSAEQNYERKKDFASSYFILIKYPIQMSSTTSLCVSIKNDLQSCTDPPPTLHLVVQCQKSDWDRKPVTLTVTRTKVENNCWERWGMQTKFRLGSRWRAAVNTAINIPVS